MTFVCSTSRYTLAQPLPQGAVHQDAIGSIVFLGDVAIGFYLGSGLYQSAGDSADIIGSILSTSPHFSSVPPYVAADDDQRVEVLDQQTIRERYLGLEPEPEQVDVLNDRDRQVLLGDGKLT